MLQYENIAHRKNALENLNEEIMYSKDAYGKNE